MDILVVGFCFGGWIANMMAVKIQNCAQFPITEDNPAEEQIKTPIMAQYAGLTLQ
jgi:carboxymethylenebutenolidase